MKYKKFTKERILIEIIMIIIALSLSMVLLLMFKHNRDINKKIESISDTETIEIEVNTEKTTEVQESVSTTTSKNEWCIVVDVTDKIAIVELLDKHYELLCEDENYQIGQELFCTFVYNTNKHEWEVVNVLEIKPTTKVEALLVQMDEEGNFKLQVEDMTYTITDPPEVWYTIELNAYGEVVGIHE